MSDKTPDPARLAALMWQPRDRASRTGLSIDAIVAAGLELAESGLDAVTMRAVAQRLGVGTMSLYTHVPGKPELLALMSDVIDALAYATGPRPADLPEWRDRVRLVGRRNFELFTEHAWRLDYEPARASIGPGLVAKYEAELTAFEGIGLSDRDMDLTLTLVQSHVRAATRWGSALARERRELDDGAWWDIVGPLMAARTTAQAYPIASRVGEASSIAYGGAVGDPRLLLDFGLEVIIDGIAARLGEPVGPGLAAKPGSLPD